MENIFVISAFIATTFIIIKFIEMRFIDKETKPLKVFIRDAFVVYFSVIIGDFLIQQINPVMSGGSKIIPAFTDNPEF